MNAAQRRRAFYEASRPLAEALFEPAPELSIAEELRPAVLEQGKALSRSGGFYYRLIRTPGGWQHTDTRCTGWVIRGTCAHVEVGRMTETALVPSNSYALVAIDAIEDEEIIEALSGQITRSWVYEFPMDGGTVRGISAVGVEEASGEMAKHGEALRVIDLKIEYEDDHEARFLVQAGRYAISNDGREALLDVTIRGKRQPKQEKRKSGAIVDDKFWYEKGVTKAVRNAKLALLPEYAKTHILAEAVKAGRVRQVQQPNRGQLPPANVDRETGEISDPITDEQRKRIGTLWQANLKDKPKLAEARRRWPEVFGERMNLLAKLSSAEADEVAAFLEGEAQQVAEPANAPPASAQGAATADRPPAAPAAPDHEHHFVFDEETTLMLCDVCSLVQDGPPGSEEPASEQAPLIH